VTVTLGRFRPRGSRVTKVQLQQRKAHPLLQLHSGAVLVAVVLGLGLPLPSPCPVSVQLTTGDDPGRSLELRA